MTWPDFLKGIADHHSGIANYFYTGIGKNLQRLEANITEAVLLKMTGMQQPCLPLHDSFITYETLGEELPLLMEQIARDHGLKSAPVKEAYTSKYDGPTGFVSMDIETALDELRERD
ncbi:hypothetical protein DC366_08215 [Pelagivirga sediminicola]|uniref:Uncharacterized protein n=2 Tax=Pelagivirga sediminicola TaxID=2170575 RepID=A0A2T7G8T9_9RHOB|nr:hypothetical protein DC366_08215 [Pelagivirga sediminicola]